MLIRQTCRDLWSIYGPRHWGLVLWKFLKQFAYNGFFKLVKINNNDMIARNIKKYEDYSKVKQLLF